MSCTFIEGGCMTGKSQRPMLLFLFSSISVLEMMSQSTETLSINRNSAGAWN
jgi:hypothetical protein